MASVNCLITNILQNIGFCVQQKKEIHTGLEQLKCWHNFIFWVNDPFKLCDGFVIIILYLMNLPTFIADCIVMSKSCNVFTFSLTIDDV